MANDLALSECSLTITLLQRCGVSVFLLHRGGTPQPASLKVGMWNSALLPEPIDRSGHMEIL